LGALSPKRPRVVLSLGQHGWHERGEERSCGEENGEKKKKRKQKKGILVIDSFVLSCEAILLNGLKNSSASVTKLQVKLFH
jgi:hypothetical protein